MKRTKTLAILTTTAALLTAALVSPAEPATATSRPDLLPDCAYGTSVPGIRGGEKGVVTRDAWAYADRVGGTAEERLDAARTFAAAEAAYFYGLSSVELHATVKSFRVRNTMLTPATLATPDSRSVVLPNNDTIYSTSWVDLLAGPLVLDVPDSDGRFYNFHFMDAYTNSFAYVGAGATGTRGGSYAIVPPGWTGTLPDGLSGTIQSPTNTIWLLGRTLVEDAADLENAKALAQKYTLTPAAAWSTGARGASVVLTSQNKREKPVTPTGTDFIATLNQLLVIDPPPPSQRCAVEALSPAGVEWPEPSAADQAAAAASYQASEPTGSQEDTPTNAAIAAGTATASALLDDRRIIQDAGTSYDGWSIPGDWIGDYGKKYLGRAFVARNGLGANTPDIAMYPQSIEDDRGRALTGKHRYRITFQPGQLPPVKSFWSLTMYGADRFLVDNEIDRYSIGDRTEGLRRNADGSLTIYLQHRRPGTAVGRANWLPAPAGAFRVTMRLYLPRASALTGAWKLPPMRRVG